MEPARRDDEADWRRAPGRGDYVRSERERRFLVLRHPDPAQAGRLIEDRYILGTSLRLRRIDVGSESVLKLTQKVRPQPQSPAHVALTNMYLTELEHELLAELPARRVLKTRRICMVEGTRFAVDDFHGALTGLVTAEVEVSSLEAELPAADWLGREVTYDDRYSGGRLATLDDEEALALLSDGEQGPAPAGF